MQTVVVVGGGCRGVLVAIHLLAVSDERCRVVLVERDEHLGAGVAYRTDAPWHVLNTPASAMSAFPDRPGHFTAWATPAAPHATEEARARSFLPRRMFRRYLQDMLAEAERQS